MPRRTLHLLAVLTSAACSGEGTENPPVVIADSAGVRIVINPKPQGGADPAWSVAAIPEVEVGGLVGAPADQLFQVSGAVVLSDGTLVVANRGTHDLRFYDAEGHHLVSVGGQGDGPGEFQALELVGRFAGDSLLTYDSRHRRASVFDGAGSFARSFRIGEAAGLTYPVPSGVLSNGTVIVQQGAMYIAGQTVNGADREPIKLFLAAPDGAVKDSFGEFPGREMFVLAVLAERWMSVRPITFGLGFFVAGGNRRVAVGNNDEFAVRVYDESGTLLHVVRQYRDPAPTTDEDFTRYIESQLAVVEEERSRRLYGQMYREMPQAESFPAYASLRFDRAGNLWIEEYPRPGTDQPVWQVFDPDGIFAARVETPEGLRILDIGEDYILGVKRDDLEVEHVRLYRINKG